MPRIRYWTKSSAKQFWRQRDRVSILAHCHSDESSLLQLQRKHEDAFETQKDEYYASLAETEAENQDDDHLYAHDISKNLAFWIKYLSWTYCEDCNLLTRKVLPHNFQKKTITTAEQCICKANKYVVPNDDEIPLALHNLTMHETRILRPFDVHCGDISRAKNGYRLKNGPFRLNVSKRSVEDKIAHLTDVDMQHKCLAAYNVLMASPLSSYSKFVRMRNEYVDNGERFSSLHIYTQEGIECAIWPSLYPFTNWCESTLSGNRDSAKISFMTKVFSHIVDYAMLFELLLFQYDRWLFKTVSGAINSARVLKCSPMRALDTKTFSPGYWQWQHLFLLDAVHQFGLPSVFVTISPFEWTFPFPYWLNKIRRNVQVGKTYLPAYETIHIANVLEQLVRGYLCGSNSARWSDHLFQQDMPSAEKNVLTYFYRFEFQKRGTLHLHLLVWVKDISHIQYSRIRADIPSYDRKLGFLAQRLQKSKDKSPFLAVQSEPTHVRNVSCKDVLSVIHPANAFANNLRAYFDTVLPTLKCSMDVQTTDGKSMVLKYVTSYVSKWHDAVSIDSLYSPNVSGHQTAFRYLKSLTPCEPEMWMTLSTVKIAWSCSRTKRYVVPVPERVQQNKEATRYRQRPVSMESLTFAQWLRAVNSAAVQPKEYKGGNTLVGLRFVSVYRKEFFFQQLLMHHPHRKVDDLYHGDFQRMPENLKYFASAILVLNTWNDMTLIREHFEIEGHKNYYIDTVVAYVTSLHDLLQCWRLHVATNRELLDISSDLGTIDFNLQGKQLVIMHTLKAAIVARNRHLAFEMPHVPSENVEVDDEGEDLAEDLEEEQIPQPEIDTNFHVDWKRYLLVTGNPGCGKTHTMNACISRSLIYRLKVCVAAPTGFLACKYKSMFGDRITTDTVHAAFKYPVQESDAPAINWELAKFDFLVIDEISMIPKPIFMHILNTIQQLPTRPIVFFSGDEAQQQPIMTVDHKIVQVENIMSDRQFLASIGHIQLTDQFRCEDPQLQNFLIHVRNWKPSQALLNSIQKETMCDGEPSDKIIIRALKQHPDATVLTVTKKACNRINMLVVDHAFPEQQPIMVEVQTDSDLPPIPIYKGMRIMLTQNRDKDRAFVNGQTATVKFVTRKTVFASLPNGQLINIYLVTYVNANGQRKTAYPFVPAYASTICKAQGQTLNKVLLWFDIDRIPAGTAYVAVSRVKTLQNLLFLTPMKVCHFTPVLS